MPEETLEAGAEGEGDTWNYLEHFITNFTFITTVIHNPQTKPQDKAVTNYINRSGPTTLLSPQTNASHIFRAGHSPHNLQKKISIIYRSITYSWFHRSSPNEGGDCYDPTMAVLLNTLFSQGRNTRTCYPRGFVASALYLY
nr:hypothetical protein L203_06505 [Cryptococcus depauperatus CBS 7841]